MHLKKCRFQKLILNGDIIDGWCLKRQGGWSQSHSQLLNQYILFKKNFKKYCKGLKFLVAVSGGPDSLALAALCKAFSYQNKSKFYFILIDHRIRKNSKEESLKVKKLLKRRQINL